MPKSDVAHLQRLARKQGFTISVATNGHLVWTAPDGRSTQTAASPGSDKAITAMKVYLRRIGLKV